MDITLQSPLRSILAIRPRAVEVLGIVAGGALWTRLDATLQDFARDHALDPDALLRGLAGLPGTEAGTDFRRAPLHVLVDFLAADHRDFRDRDLPGLERALAEADPADFPDAAVLQDLRASLHSFKIDLLLHLNEEEEFLFPKVLRTEASADHPDLSPESFRGSVAAYPAVMLHMPENQVKDLLASLLRKAGAGGGSLPPAADRFRARLEEFAARLTRHADLETEVLLPRTLVLEKALHRRALDDSRAMDDA